MILGNLFILYVLGMTSGYYRPKTDRTLDKIFAHLHPYFNQKLNQLQLYI